MAVGTTLGGNANICLSLDHEPMFDISETFSCLHVEPVSCDSEVATPLDGHAQGHFLRVGEHVAQTGERFDRLGL